MIKDYNNNNLLIKDTQNITNNINFDISLDDTYIVDIYVLYSNVQYDDVIIINNL